MWHSKLKKNNWKVADWDIASAAIVDWAESSLAGHAQIVRARLNRFDTRVQRKNQVLYCIAKHAEDEFNASDVDRYVREEFSHTASADRLGIDQILKGLTQGDQPLLSKDRSTNRFRLRHPKLRIAIRYVLKKTEDGNISENKSINQPYFY